VKQRLGPLHNTEELHIMPSGNNNNRYVQPRPDGHWEVVGENHQRASAVAGTQAEAINRAREIVGNAGGGELVIKNRQSQIRDSDTVAPGNESPARDRK
jgi:hypothetical protein